MKEFWKDILLRLRSPVTIGCLLALAYFVVKTWAGFEIREWDKFVELLLTAGLALGVLNNPTTREKF